LPKFNRENLGVLFDYEIKRLQRPDDIDGLLRILRDAGFKVEIY
jgi:hypothetical protein